jgi:hypothetical protein
MFVIDMVDTVIEIRDYRLPRLPMRFIYRFYDRLVVCVYVPFRPRVAVSQCNIPARSHVVAIGKSGNPEKYMYRKAPVGRTSCS